MRLATRSVPPASSALGKPVVTSGVSTDIVLHARSAAGALPHVVAAILNSRLNFFADSHNPLSLLAPASRRSNGRDRTSFLHDQQFAPGVQINVHDGSPPKSG